MVGRMVGRIEAGHRIVVDHRRNMLGLTSCKNEVRLHCLIARLGERTLSVWFV